MISAWALRGTSSMTSRSTAPQSASSGSEIFFSDTKPSKRGPKARRFDSQPTVSNYRCLWNFNGILWNLSFSVVILYVCIAHSLFISLIVLVRRFNVAIDAPRALQLEPHVRAHAHGTLLAYKTQLAGPLQDRRGGKAQARAGVPCPNNA